MATILIVDDCLPTLLTLERILHSCGHEVFATISAEHAILIATTGKDIDLLITDYTMPEMTGHQLIDQVRSYRPALPIIIRTGAGLSDRGKANLLLSKDSEVAVVLDAIRQLLKPQWKSYEEAKPVSEIQLDDQASLGRRGGDSASQG